jgi:hypothetical protein
LEGPSCICSHCRHTSDDILYSPCPIRNLCMKINILHHSAIITESESKLTNDLAVAVNAFPMFPLYGTIIVVVASYRA